MQIKVSFIERERRSFLQIWRRMFDNLFNQKPRLVHGSKNNFARSFCLSWNAKQFFSVTFRSFPWPALNLRMLLSYRQAKRDKTFSSWILKSDFIFKHFRGYSGIGVEKNILFYGMARAMNQLKHSFACLRPRKPTKNYGG